MFVCTEAVVVYVCIYVCLELCSSRISKHWACQSMRHNHTIEPQSLHSTGLCLGFRVPKTRCGAPTFFFLRVFLLKATKTSYPMACESPLLCKIWPHDRA